MNPKKEKKNLVITRGREPWFSRQVDLSLFLPFHRIVWSPFHTQHNTFPQHNTFHFQTPTTTTTTTAFLSLGFGSPITAAPRNELPNSESRSLLPQTNMIAIPYLTALTTYFSYGLLFAFGQFRDFFRKIFDWCSANNLQVPTRFYILHIMILYL